MYLEYDNLTISGILLQVFTNNIFYIPTTKNKNRNDFMFLSIPITSFYSSCNFVS